MPQETKQLTERILLVLEYLARRQMPVKASEIASDLNLPLASVLRYLNSLIFQGYVYRNEAYNSYGATWKICGMADAIKSSFSLRSYASPFLVELSHTLKVGSCLVIEQDHKLLYVDFVDNPSAGLQGLKRVGRDGPIYCTGSGKVLLSSFNPTKRNTILSGLKLTSYAKNTITRRDVLERELNKVSKQNYAIDDEECEDGYRCISVPLYDYTGQVIAAVSVFDVVENMPGDRVRQEVLPKLKEISMKISENLGYRPNGQE